MVTVTPHGLTALYCVYVDDIWVGLGYRPECDALADELRADPDKAVWLKENCDISQQGVLELPQHTTQVDDGAEDPDKLLSPH